MRPAEGADARVELFAFNRHAPAEVAPRGEPGMDTIAKDVPLEWVEGAKAASEVASILAETRATAQVACTEDQADILGRAKRKSPLVDGVWWSCMENDHIRPRSLFSLPQPGAFARPRRGAMPQAIRRGVGRAACVPCAVRRVSAGRARADRFDCGFDAVRGRFRGRSISGFVHSIVALVSRIVSYNICCIIRMYYVDCSSRLRTFWLLLAVVYHL